MGDEEGDDKKKKKKNASKYNYTFGDVHPGEHLLVSFNCVFKAYLHTTINCFKL